MKIIEESNQLLQRIQPFLENLGLLTRASHSWFLYLLAFCIIWIVLYYYRFIENKNHFYTTDTFFIVTLMLGIIILRIPSMFYIPSDPDESQWMVGAATFAKYPKFWLSVDGTTSGPLVVIPLSIVVWLGGALSYSTARLFATFFFLMPSISLTYFALSRFYCKEIAYVVAVMITFLVATQNALLNYNGEFSIILLISLALYCYSKISLYPDSSKLYFITGIVISCMVFTKPQAIPIAFVIFLAVIVKMNVHQIQYTKILLLTLGGFVPIFFLAAYLINNNLTNDFYYSYIANSLSYGNKDGVLMNDKPLYRVVGKTIKYFFIYADNPYYFFISSLVIIIGIIQLFKKKKYALWGKFGTNYNLYFFVVLVLVSAFCVAKPKTFFIHYQNILLIPVAYMLANGLYTIHVQQKKYFYFIFLILSMGLSLIIVSNKISRDEIAWVYDTSKPKTKLVTIIKKYTYINDRMVVWGYNPELFIECGLIQGTREAHSHYAMIDNDLQDYYLNRFLRDIQTNQPRVIVEDFGGIINKDYFGLNARSNFGLEKYTTLYNYISKNYTLVADIDNKSRVFVIKSRSTIQSLSQNVEN